MFYETVLGVTTFLFLVYLKQDTIEKYIFFKPGEGELKLKTKKKKRKLYVNVTGNKLLLLQNYKIPSECDFYITSGEINESIIERKSFIYKYPNLNMKKLEKFKNYLVPDIIKKKDLAETNNSVFVCIHDYYSENMYSYKCNSKFIDYEEIISQYENDLFENIKEDEESLNNLDYDDQEVKKIFETNSENN